MNKNFPALFEAVNRLKMTEGGTTAVSEILSRYVEQGRQEGRLESRLEGHIETLYKLAVSGILSMDEAVKQSGISREEFMKIVSQVSPTV